MHIKKKAAVRFIIVYLVLTVGFIMFIDSYANSSSRMRPEKTVPAVISVADGYASISILGYGKKADLSVLSPESRLYCILYVLSPDAVREAVVLLIRSLH